MSQKNLYYSLFDENGKILSLRNFKKAIGFRFYWRNKKVDDFLFGSNWTNQEKKLTLDNYYFKIQKNLLKNEEKKKNLKESLRIIKKELPLLEPDQFYNFYLDSNNNLLDHKNISKAKQFLTYYGYELVRSNDFKKISASKSIKKREVTKALENAKEEIFIKETESTPFLKDKKPSEIKKIQKYLEKNQDEIDVGYPDEFFEALSDKYNYRLVYRDTKSYYYSEQNKKLTYIKVKKAFANPIKMPTVLPSETGSLDHDRVKDRIWDAVNESWDYTHQYGLQSIDNKFIIKLTYGLLYDDKDLTKHFITTKDGVKIISSKFDAKLELKVDGVSTRRMYISDKKDLKEAFEDFWKKFTSRMRNYTGASRAFGYVIRTAMVESVVDMNITNEPYTPY